MKRKEFEKLKVGDICADNIAISETYGKKGRVLLIDNDSIVLKTLDGSNWKYGSSLAKIRVFNWKGLRLVESTEKYTVPIVARMFDVSTEQVRRWLRTGMLGGYKSSNKGGWVISDTELESFMCIYPKYRRACNG